MKRIFTYIFIFLFILNGMIGCTLNEILPVKEITPTSDIQPKITATLEMTPTLGKPETNTWVPKSTLTEVEKEEIISDLIKTNGGCNPPCWWGITPGKTNGSEAISFLERFVDLSYIGEVNEFTQFIFKYQYLGKNNSTLIYVDKDDNISLIVVDNFQPISETMKNLGTPSEVWFRADGIPLFEAVSIDLDLYYPQKGVIVSFSDDGIQYYDKGTIRFCRNDLDKNGTFLLFADPVKFSTYYSISSMLLGTLPETRIVDGSFSDWTSSTLYAGLFDKNINACFSSDAKNWQ